MYVCVQYLVQIEVVVYTKRDKMRQTLGSEVLFGNAQLFVTEGALIDS